MSVNDLKKTRLVNFFYLAIKENNKIVEMYIISLVIFLSVITIYRGIRKKSYRYLDMVMNEDNYCIKKYEAAELFFGIR